MLKIWGRKNSLNVQKVLWGCAELGIAHERVDWGGPFGGNDDPAFRAMNPNGMVPTIQDGDTIVWESNTILRYLCGKYDGGGLHPADPTRRADIERWMDWQLSIIMGSMAVLVIGYLRTAPDKRDPVALEAGRKKAVDHWAIVERQLDGRRHVAGDAFSLADICLGVLAHRWFNFAIERPDLPRTLAWYERIAERVGFATHAGGPLT
jgi:glutathione S-transferase